MRMKVLAGALAFAMAGIVVSASQPAHAGGLETRLSGLNLARIKEALNLTAQQRPLWARLEAVLASVTREQQETGFLRRVGQRAAALVWDDAAIERVKAAALPLISSLSEEQRTTARRLAHQLGMGEVVAMLN